MLASDLDPGIVSKPGICSGKPVVRGTRIMVKNILGMVAGGYDTARILKAHPELTAEDVSAILHYAAKVMEKGRVLFRARQANSHPSRPKHTG